MNEIVELLNRQNTILESNNKLITETVAEFKRIMKLQAAELKVGNARMDVFGSSLISLLENVSDVGEKSGEILKQIQKSQMIKINV